ncbi:MAG: methionyl-tRNA formyltransferase [Bacillota bacterium]|jgi:methionyl-tRNA formyltransferase
MKDLKEVKFLLMGTPELARDVFQSIHQEGYKIVGLVCQPDTLTGRDKTITKPPTKIWAEANQIPVFQPEKIKEQNQFLNQLDVDFILTLAYGQIVPQVVLDKPRFGAFNFHGSLLPKYRGASPIRYALINQEKETGMTLMKMVMAMDAGPIYAMKRLPILEDDNYTSLLQRFSTFTSQFALQVLPRLCRGELSPIYQNEKEVTFAPLIKKEDEHFNLSLPIDSLLGWIRGLADIPGGYFMYGDKKLKVFHASIHNRSQTHPIGMMIKADHEGLHLQVNGGILNLLHVQIEGKGKMLGSVFGNGHRQLQGQLLT